MRTEDRSGFCFYLHGLDISWLMVPKQGWSSETAADYLVNTIDQCFSDVNVHRNHLGIFLKCSLRVSRFKVGGWGSIILEAPGILIDTLLGQCSLSSKPWLPGLEPLGLCPRNYTCPRIFQVTLAIKVCHLSK